MFNRVVGVKDYTYSEGTHVLVPWFEWPIIFDVRTRPRAIRSTTGTRDLQMVDIGLRVLTRPDPSALPTIYRSLGLDYDDKVLPSIVNEVVKQVIAQFNATALLTQREQVSRKIKTNLEDRARDFNIVLDDVSITDLKFGREFERAVEAKQVAQQVRSSLTPLGKITPAGIKNVMVMPLPPRLASPLQAESYASPTRMC